MNKSFEKQLKPAEQVNTDPVAMTVHYEPYVLALEAATGDDYSPFLEKVLQGNEQAKALIEELVVARVKQENIPLSLGIEEAEKKREGLISIDPEEAVRILYDSRYVMKSQKREEEMEKPPIEVMPENEADVSTVEEYMAVVRKNLDEAEILATKECPRVIDIGEFTLSRWLPKDNIIVTKLANNRPEPSSNNDTRGYIH